MNNQEQQLRVLELSKKIEILEKEKKTSPPKFRKRIENQIVYCQELRLKLQQLKLL